MEIKFNNNWIIVIVENNSTLKDKLNKIDYGEEIDNETHYQFMNTYNVLKKVNNIATHYKHDFEGKTELNRQLKLWNDFLASHVENLEVKNDDVLREHQRKSKNKLTTIIEKHPYNIESGRKSALELSEVRTGKTPKIISIIKDLKADGVERFLVVTPASLTSNFASQAQKLYNLKTINFSNIKVRDREVEIELFKRNGGILIISITTLKNMVSDFVDLKNCIMIVDEAEFIRKDDTLQTAAILRLSKVCDGAILMTGTPLSGDIQNMLNYYKVMWPDFFKSKTPLLEYFFYKSVENYGYGDVVEYAILKEHHKEDYYEIKDLCSDRVMQEEYLTWVDKTTTEETILLNMDEIQQQIYDMFMKWNAVYVDEEGDFVSSRGRFELDTWHICSVDNTFSKIMACRQLTNNPDSIEKSFNLGIIDSKTEFITNWVKENPHEQVIIADWSTAYLKILHNIFGNKCGFIHGDVTQRQRANIIEDFKSGRIRILIANNKTISHGHTFDYCDNIIISSLDWDPNINYQLKNRITDTTDYEKHNEKRIMTLINKGSIDELVMTANKNKINIMSIINKRNDINKYLKEAGFPKIAL